MKRTVRKSTEKSQARTRVAITLTTRRRMVKELRQAEEHIALSALDALAAQIAILDADGTILATNQAWRVFARAGACGTDRGATGENYFQKCVSAESRANGFDRFCEGVQAVLKGSQPEFSIEYPCQVGREERWFHGKVTRFGKGQAARVVVAHEDISQRVQLEREIVDVSAREQQRFGEELHDGLSQHLTGLKFKASLLEYQLQSRNVPEAADAKALSEMLNDATDEASKLARSVRPVEIESRGLMMALRELATNTAHVHDVKCWCDFRRPVFIHDNNVATHVYRITEEAVSNALKHGEPTQITIALSETKDCVTLTVRDNGRGLPRGIPKDGLGLHMMRYRARMIGGSIELERQSSGGTLARCTFQKRFEPRAARS
jgi:signal transduction histidine kinase